MQPIENLELNDRCAVFVDQETGERVVCMGDGQTLPYRSFILEKVFEMARPFFLSPESNITAIDGRKLSGLVGAMLARQSRIPGTIIDVLVKEFLVTDEKEAKELGVEIGGLREGKLDRLIERILIQYGDDSVQELEFSTVLFNSVSNVATKMIEDRRLGAYIEQSSRYVLYTEKDPITDNWYYYRDPAIMNSPLAGKYIDVMDRCFELYVDLAHKLQEYYKGLKPIEEVEYALKPNDDTKYRFDQLDDDKQRKAFKRSYTFDIRTRACDTARIFLPAATLTNVAMVANGRTFEHLLKRLYSEGRNEFKDIANRLHDTLNKVIPKYVKRADRGGVKFWMDVDRQMVEDMRTYLPEALVWGGSREEVVVMNTPNVITRDRVGAEHMLAAAYFPYARTDYQALMSLIVALPDETFYKLLHNAVGSREIRRDRAVRGFEHGYPIFTEMVCDFGVFRDLHRHRMCTLQWQRPNPHLGFVIPEDVDIIGMKDACIALEREVSDLYDQIEQTLGPKVAEYVVLFGHNIRFSIGMNLREAQHLLELRTVAQGHPNYRRVCQKIDIALREKAPWLNQTDMLKFVNHNQYHWARADAEARQSQKAIERGLDV
ncbi:hypothetical protein HON52_02990 [Candidatus Uhrbacteria bacterium]|jgi:thymidylate synthase ThyX|nr:hypothetical protein [Candidatus Uhrbacteria bacterium]